MKLNQNMYQYTQYQFIILNSAHKQQQKTELTQIFHEEYNKRKKFESHLNIVSICCFHKPKWLTISTKPTSQTVAGWLPFVSPCT